MTRDEFNLWSDFALRMARTCFRTSRRPSAEWIVEQVEEFLGRVRDDNANDFVLLHDWDSPPHLCDLLTEFWDGRRAVPRGRCRACEQYDDEAECRCDERDDACYEQWNDQWGGPVACCIRAGLGFAIDGASGMGVMGFTAGDIRRMYPEGVPERFARSFDGGQTIGAAAIIPGVGFVPDPRGPSPRFEDMPDTDHLWL